jgi:mycofactocin system transcriptional regulator
LTIVSSAALDRPSETKEGAALGRPPVTTHATIEREAFALFERQGFDLTTLDDIAAAVGVGRRTLFRYYPSKNDILWGQFDHSLRHFDEFLAATALDARMSDAIRSAVLDFNTFDASAIPQHRQRMRLLLTTPALQAHSELRYAAWRDVIARFVARRTGLEQTHLVPAVAGRVSLALSLSAYEQWLDHEDASLPELLTATFDALASFVAA